MSYNRVKTFTKNTLARGSDVAFELDAVGVAIDAAETAASADAAAAAASAAAAAADAVSTAADALATAADVVSTGADAAATAADAIATAADRVQTGLDAAATAADVISTAADAASTAADVISTAADASATAAALAVVQGEALSFTFSATTTMADPGAGIVRLNNATVASATAIAIDDTSAATGNPDVSAYIISWDDSTNTVKGHLLIQKIGAPETFALFQLDSLTDNAGWTQLAVTYITGSGAFSGSDSLGVQFFRAGDKGTDGAGDVVGPASATDSAIVLFDGTTGKLIKDSATALTTLQPKPSEGAFADGDKTKLDGIEAGAQVNDIGIVIALG